jgi:hypothetical protein
MAAQALTSYLDELERAARGASAAEEAYRREAAARFRQFEQERAFGFRRLNLMRTVTAAVGEAQDEDEAAQAGGQAFLRELEWSAATELQRQTLEQFRPVILAAWRLTQAEEEAADVASDVAADVAALAAALTTFEQWFAAARDMPFLSLMEREPVELPLVEV